MPSAWLYWCGLLLALIAVVLAYRGVSPPAGWCVEQILDSQSNRVVALPLSVAPDAAGDHTLVLAHRFIADRHDWVRPAVYLGQASPFYGLRLNGRDLTPDVDLGRHDRRDRGPHLHALPVDALTAGSNTLTLRIPVTAALGGSRVEMLCIGDHAVLQDVHRANWWRRIGVPYLCLALFAVLILIALALRRLNRGSPIYSWYLGCLLLMAFRTVYLVAVEIPGGPIPWRAASDLSILLLVFAMYRLMALFWGIALNRWATAWLVGAGALQLSAASLNWDIEYPIAKIAFWLSAAGVVTMMMIQARPHIRGAPAVERLGMQWAVLFAIGCGVLEVITHRLDLGLRLPGLYSLATAQLALMFGFLLTRRALMGTKLLSRATRSLSYDLDRALQPASEHSATLWQELSGSIADSERRRMLHDIDEGFGSRMLSVLAQIRRDHPQSRLSGEIQRALLDLRLMIDAMDDASASIGSALATLRQRLEGPLSAAGISSTWDVAGISHLQVNDRRRLMEVFRCLEELLSNVVQHARAKRVVVAGRSSNAMIVLHVEDDGCGLSQQQAKGRGLRNVHTRVQMLLGTVVIDAGEMGGTRVELTLPLI
jgi:signal transduction histidine kinase